MPTKHSSERRAAAAPQLRTPSRTPHALWLNDVARLVTWQVERMVREANRQTELDTHGVAPPPPAAPARSGVVESRDLTGCTVQLGTFADAGSLLNAVNLPQYESVFREEAMEPDTLIEVLQQQGKAALEGALKELGIKSMGHRLKIVNALIVQ